MILYSLVDTLRITATALSCKAMWPLPLFKLLLCI